jgi:type II secretory pathway predicted ATPase ExeA
MHESFFGLQKRPFLSVPTLERYCPVASQEAAFESCQRAISRAEGPVAIFGGAGLGKSMVCLRVGDVFRRAYEVVLLSSSQICSRRALLQNLLFELRMPYRDMNEGELRLSLLDRLQPSHENPTDGLVLIVDEAQTLSIKLLEELRMITNLARDGVPRVRLILAGTMRLEELLSHQQLESLNQRIVSRCYLTPLTSDETVNYVRYKIERCGANIQAVMTEEAMRMIHRATDGVPRLIDQLADQALRLAADNRQKPCSVATIEAAWASLQQIPLPWSDPGTPLPTAASTIEFGALEDDAESEFAAGDPLQAPVLEGLYSSHRHPTETLQQPADRPNLKHDENTGLSLETIDRSLWSPIPSAGMGLSTLTLGPSSNPAVPAGSETSSDDHRPADPWESFVQQAPMFGRPPGLRNFFDDEFEPFAASQQQPSWMAETVDFPGGTSFAEASEAMPSPEPRGDALPSSRVSEPSAPPIPADPFGDGFTEEQPVASIVSELAETYYPYYRDAELPRSSDEQASRRLPVESMEDPQLRPYEQLLDHLSSANLQAMTFDPSEALNADRPNWAAADAEERLPDFEGGLSRQTRSTILSFANLPEASSAAISDDRDLLIIEEDLPLQPNDYDSEKPVAAVVHPYKQLFSKLRG